jgi:tetratricopeptide (TPR) repeat protein
MLNAVRLMIVGFASRRASSSSPRGAVRWHRLACAVAPGFVPSYRALVELLREQENRWAARAVAQEAAERFPEDSDAWMLLGLGWQLVYRQQEALAAFEQALVLAERPDAALASGAIYQRFGQHADAATRFAQAYAAGGGPEALRQNAEALFHAGDEAAAEQALALWAAQVPEGMERLPQIRAALRAGRRAG